MGSLQCVIEFAVQSVRLPLTREAEGIPLCDTEQSTE